MFAEKADIELGWFLMRWQGHLRYLAESEPVIVDCEEWQRPLVDDFAFGFGHPLPDEKSVKYTKHLGTKKNLKQRFIRYGTEGKQGYDIVIHARNIDKGVHRNWCEEKWVELLTNLYDYSIVFVGTKNGSRGFKPGYGDDKRGLSLEELCDIMRNSRLFIGESSGPAHLASLCGLSHLVITDNKKWRVGWKKTTNWNRYKKLWNPLSTPAYILDQDNYDPPVEKVLRAIDKNGLL